MIRINLMDKRTEEIKDTLTRVGSLSTSDDLVDYVPNGWLWKPYGFLVTKDEAGRLRKVYPEYFKPTPTTCPHCGKPIT